MGNRLPCPPSAVKVDVREGGVQINWKTQLMKTTRLVPIIVLALCMATMATRAPGATITYNTNAPGTGFGGTNLQLANSSGANATLTYLPNANGNTGVPSNINFGIFALLCPGCSPDSLVGSTFDAFAFELIITDVTHNATGRFIGFSTGGMVFGNSSEIDIDWVPLELGPGTNNAATGNFSSTIFQITNRTRIVAPNSGLTPGQTTVSGSILSQSDFPIVAEIPEPATAGLVGVLLIGLGFWGRRRR